MFLDFFILINTAISVLISLFFHLLVFRNIRKEKTIYFLPLVVGLGCIFPVIITGSAGNLIPQIFGQHQPEYLWAATINSIILYLLSMFIYILGVFGLMAASVRIRLLCDIAKKGNEGITQGELQQSYNPKIIAEKRLERLVSSGILDYRQGQYRLKNRRSLFFLYVSLILLLRKLYTGN